MARKPRFHYDGAIYHVIARGNNQERIFLEPNDKIKYLEFVARYKQTFNYELLAYVLMNNHVHMLIRIDRFPYQRSCKGFNSAILNTSIANISELDMFFNKGIRHYYVIVIVIWLLLLYIYIKIRYGLDYRKEFTTRGAAIKNILLKIIRW